jgi:lysophospholipase L1-like esterase
MRKEKLKVFLKRERWIFFLAIMCIFIAVLSTNAYRKIRKEMASIKAGVAEVKTEMASIKAGVAEVKTEAMLTKGFIPPLYGARHIELRKLFILSQAQQLQEEFILVTGDSMTEGLYLSTLGKFPVLNGGMGGGGVHALQELLNDFPSESKLRGIIIAIGVNDAVRGAPDTDYLGNWNKEYLSLVKRAKALTRNVAISTIIPVESGKTLGVQYFDLDLINRLNAIIRNVSAEQKTVLIDNDNMFRDLHEKNVEYTVDGVHMNRLGFDPWKKSISMQLPSPFLE